jgi:hypothetical protein
LIWSTLAILSPVSHLIWPVMAILSDVSPNLASSALRLRP